MVLNPLKALTRILAARKSKSLREPWHIRNPYVRATAGVSVTPDTSLKVAAVWRCVNYISQTVSMLPWEVIRKEGTRSVVQENNPVARTLNISPNSEMTPFTWREAMLQSTLLWGNGFSEIVRDGAGRVRALWYITPERVEVKRDLDTGQAYYLVSNQGGGGNVTLSGDDMLHLKGAGYDGLIGYSVVAYAAQTLGSGIAMDDHNGAFYGNSAAPGGVLSYPGKLSVEAKKRLSSAWDRAFRGSKQSFKTAVLEEGLVFQPITIPQKDAQYIESRDFNVLDVCRWFGVPPHKVFDWSENIYSSAEVANRDVITDTILPWVKRLEEEVDKRLLRENYGGLYSRMQISGLLRGDPKSRSDYYQGLSKIGAISINEVRGMEDMNAIPNGDAHLVAANNYLPLDLVLSGATPAAQKQVGLQENMSEGDEEGESEELDDDTVSARIQEQLYLSLFDDAVKQVEGEREFLDLVGLREAMVPNENAVA